MKKRKFSKPASILINLLLVCLSLSPLIALEVYLRLTNYGYMNKLFIKAPNAEMYVLNRQIYRKYFSTDPLVKNSRIPSLFPKKRFKASKGANDFRIFCFGGSTTFGDFSDRSFPDILNDMLSSQTVGKRVEVINLGITTLNSYQVSDFVAEVVDYEPDLFIIYMGHNEIYGPQGVASSSRTTFSHWLTSVVLFLQRFKSFQLAEDFYLKLHDIDSKENRKRGLFKVMAKSAVLPSSPLREKSLTYFTRNLDEIIQQSKQHNVPLILTTIASNIRDFRPFDSEVPPEGLADKWRSILDAAMVLKAEQRYRESEEKFLQAIGLYSDNAQQYYDLGHVYIELGKYDLALEALTKAKDLDLLPFRAPSGINQVIKQRAREAGALQPDKTNKAPLDHLRAKSKTNETAKQNSPETGIFLLDAERILQKKSPHRLIGKPIMVEHLHPSAYGHYFIAAGLARLIYVNGLLQYKKRVDFEDPNVMANFDVKKYSERFKENKIWPFIINNYDYSFP